MRRTKIVCTLGPSSNDFSTIERIMLEGMDVARLNFSHGTHDDHRTMFETVRRAAARIGKPVAVMADLQGPKIRTGRLAGGKPVTLVPGAPICITTRETPGDAQCVSTLTPSPDVAGATLLCGRNSNCVVEAGRTSTAR